MVSNNGDGRASADFAAAGTAVREIELYDELVAFTELSPESRRYETNRLDGRSKEESVELSSVEDVESPEVSRASGPLFGLSANSELTFTGALTRGVCLSCGAESGADDVFCVNCGAFIDEVDSNSKAKPACSECGEPIVAEEIFCPSCGSVQPAA